MSAIHALAFDEPLLSQLVFFLLAGGLTALLLRRIARNRRRLLVAWAEEHGFAIVKMKHRLFGFGPFAFRSKGYWIYRVHFRDSQGKELTGFARVGGFFFGNHVDVDFDQ